MPGLTRHLDPATIQQLQKTFSEVAGTTVRVFDAEGASVPSTGSQGSDEADEGACDVPIRVGDEVIGRLVARPMGHVHGDADWLHRFLMMMANVIGRLCDREKQLRTRVEELATLYHLTSDFAAAGDIQSLLDRVAATVVKVLNAKACSIRLLDEERKELFIKSVANLSPKYLEKGPILLSESEIDREVIKAGRPVYIADERTDPRVLYPAEAASEGIVSALCAPLMYKGRTEGVLRVYTERVHAFDWFEVSLLEAIAYQAAAAIANARLHDAAVTGESMRRQLRLAGVVQRRMIPESPPQIPGFDIGAVYVPCFELGGDFYDFIDLPPGNLGVGICDVAGKGVRASLLMASIRASLRAHAMNVYDMSEVMAKVNRDLCADTLTSDFATMFYGVLNVASRRLTYANAGHVPPMLFRNKRSCHLVTGGGVLGIDTGLSWGHDSFILHSGDVILCCTDGLPEAMNFRDEAFGMERAEAAALAAIADGRDAQGIAKHVLWEMRRFAGLQRRLDDLTMVTIRAL